jgi:excisionase family DNA binding protein
LKSTKTLRTFQEDLAMHIESRDGRLGVLGGLSCGEAAAFLGLSRSTIRRQVELGRLRAKATPGRHLRFEVADLERFADELRAGALHARA